MNLSSIVRPIHRTWTLNQPCLPFVSIEGEVSQITDTKSPMMKSLISRAGDLQKNNDRLKFALVSIRYPQSYDERA